MSRLRKDADRGAVAIIVALLMPVLVGIAALALDAGREQILGWQLQKTADAAALAGSVFLPNDPVTADVRARATVVQNFSGATVSTQVVPNHPTQLQVTVSAPIQFAFAQIFGFSGATVTRTGVGEYAAPSPMGSPCNTFGNEPASTSFVPPSGSVLQIGAGGAFAQCRNPQLWAEVEGPDVSKVQGDRYATRNCDNGPVAYWQCNGTTNVEFKPEGYFYLVRVQPGGVGQTVSLQIYDPAYVYTGQTCEQLPSSGISNGMNPYAPDATSRYDNAGNGFCTGDNYPSSGAPYAPNQGQSRATVTSYQLRSPTLTQNPLAGTPLPSCAAQFNGWAKAPTAAELNSRNAKYDAQLAQVFHQWYQLCTFTPTEAGDYYLQIRTNVAAPNNTQHIFGPLQVNSAQLQSSTPTDNTSVHGDGANGFAMRLATSGDATQFSIAGYQRMAMFINANSSTSTFNLIRADPSAAGKRLVFSFYDAGDATANGGGGNGSGTFKIIPPSDGQLGGVGWSSILGCTGQLNSSATLSSLGGNCTATVTSAQNNGQLYTVYVPIPQNYTCNFSSAGGCWFQVTINFPNTQVHDVTTWDASIQGDPVRLMPNP